jgi:hypothetical protein
MPWQRAISPRPARLEIPSQPYRPGRLTLALAQPASTFIALQHVIGLPIFGLGMAAVLFYRGRLRARRPLGAGGDQPGQAS